MNTEDSILSSKVIYIVLLCGISIRSGFALSDIYSVLSHDAMYRFGSEVGGWRYSSREIFLWSNSAMVAFAVIGWSVLIFMPSSRGIYLIGAAVLLLSLILLSL